MKTACIFTFHNVPNYGAVLQTYALSHYVKQKLGYHVDIMDYQCVGNGCEFVPEEYIKKKFQGKEVSYDKTVLNDGTIIFDIVTSQIKQRCSFTEI